MYRLNLSSKKKNVNGDVGKHGLRGALIGGSILGGLGAILPNKGPERALTAITFGLLGAGVGSSIGAVRKSNQFQREVLNENPNLARHGERLNKIENHLSNQYDLLDELTDRRNSVKASHAYDEELNREYARSLFR